MLESFIIAFAMYSRIPMPRVQWTEKGMRYSMCFFPFVGAVIGVMSLLLFGGMHFLRFTAPAAAAALTVLPVLVNGGIHMDGFLDTVDAGRSYKPREEKLAILKDPHTGAFAVIYTGVYFLLTFGLFCEVTGRELPFIAAGYYYSRILSALSVLCFPKAKKDGTAAAFSDAAGKKAIAALAVQLFLCGAIFLRMDFLYGGVCLGMGFLALGYYALRSKRVFGGITGDLAGYFLQLCELGILFGAVMTGKILAVAA